MTRITTTDRPRLYALMQSGEVVNYGQLAAGDYLATALDVVSAEDENEYLGALPAEAFPPLPDSGWLEAGAIYQHGEQAVMVRQGHNRTEHDPADVPALFLVYRADASDVLPWVAGEQVYVGTQRTYDGVTYQCLQTHVSQVDWTPDVTPALWAMVVPEEPGTPEWAVGVAYTIGDVVTYNGAEYQCRQSHTSQAGWTPPAVLALWLPL